MNGPRRGGTISRAERQYVSRELWEQEVVPVSDKRSREGEEEEGRLVADDDEGGGHTAPVRLPPLVDVFLPPPSLGPVSPLRHRESCQYRYRDIPSRS